MHYFRPGTSAAVMERPSDRRSGESERRATSPLPVKTCDYTILPGAWHASC
jgi:hypothetical protein